MTPIPPPVPSQTTAEDDFDLLAAAMMDPDEWRDREYKRIGYQADLMTDVAWRSRHDTPPPRPEIRQQPTFESLPQRLQTLALAKSMEAAGMPVTLRPEFAHPALRTTPR